MIQFCTKVGGYGRSCKMEIQNKYMGQIYSVEKVEKQSKMSSTFKPLTMSVIY